MTFLVGNLFSILLKDYTKLIDTSLCAFENTLLRKKNLSQVKLTDGRSPFEPETSCIDKLQYKCFNLDLW